MACLGPSIKGCGTRTRVNFQVAHGQARGSRLHLCPDESAGTVCPRRAVF